MKHGLHWFVADAHLRPDNREGLDAMIEFLRRAGREHCSGLYLLGDVFHAWYYKTVREEPAYAPVVEEINKLAVSGCRVMLFVGNRDFLLLYSDDFADSVAVLDRGMSVAINGDTFYLGHGDELCTNDASYQRYRRMIRSRLSRYCVTHLPLKMRRRIAGQMTEKSAEGNRTKPKATIEIPGDQYELLARQGHTYIIHGHTHEERHEIIRQNGHETRVVVLPPWQSGRMFGIYNPTDRSFHVERA